MSNDPQKELLVLYIAFTVVLLTLTIVVSFKIRGL